MLYQFHGNRFRLYIHPLPQAVAIRSPLKDSI